MRLAYLAAAGALLLAGLVPVVQDVPNLLFGPYDWPLFTGIEALLGLGTMLLGLVNLANARHGAADLLLRRSATLANAAVALVLVVMLIRGGAVDFYFSVLAALAVITTALSIPRASLEPGATHREASAVGLRSETP
jgi:hypothetical protein